MPRSFTKRGLTGGITGWDGAVDLVKMNLSNHENSVEMRQGNNQAKNYMFNIAKYWTRTTRNELIMDVAQNLHKNGDISSSKNKKYLHKLESNHGLDENKLNDIAIGIAKDKKDYASGILNNKPASKLIKEKILDFPLESLNFSPELLAVLSTPYITPRPSADGNPAADALEIYEDAKRNTHVKLSKTAQKIYDETLPAQIKDLMCTIQKEQNDSSRNFFEFDGDGISEITPYGRYFLEFAMDDMMNFFITEGLFDGDNKASYKDGFLDYTAADENTKGDGKRLTLNKLKIKEATPENEAEAVVKKIKSGIEKIKISKPKEYQKFKNYLEQKYCQIDTAEYKIAEAVVDKTKAGLNWRFDATKDVGDFDEAKQGLLTSAQVMDDVIDFWQPFMQAIRKYNPSFYCIAEVTSLGDFNNYDWGKYKNAQTAEANFYEITGATTGSNYSTYFGIYPKLFGQNTEEGNIENFRSISNFMDETYKFVHPDDSKGRIPSEFIIGSHVFLDNQDKPRTSHLMGIDAKLFWSDFKQNEDYKYRAENVLKRQYDDNMSSKAVAVGEKYLEYFEAEGKKIGLDKSQIDLLKEAVSHLANGYKFTKPNVKTALKPDFNRASAFGATPYEISIPLVIKQAQALGLEIDENTKAKLTDAVWFDMVKPYASKMPAIYEMMRGTVGIPTIFSGDDLLQTGAEARSKNWYLGNRNPIRHDWLDEHAKQEVIDFNTRIQKNNELSNKPGMSALSNGTPVVVLPDVIGASTKNEIIEGAAALNDGDLRNAFGFLNSAKSGSKEDILNELKSLDEDELKTKLGSQLSKVNFGLASWVRKNINPALLQDCQQGAVYKYNDKNEGVLSIFTNAYIDKNENKITPLVDLADDKKPRLSSITLKDNDGNLIAKPGTVFVRKTYSNQKCDYVDDGIFVLNADGKLIRQNGSDSTLDSTVTYFCKYNPFYTNYSKTIG